MTKAEKENIEFYIQEFNKLDVSDEDSKNIAEDILNDLWIDFGTVMDNRQKYKRKYKKVFDLYDNIIQTYRGITI